MITATYNGKYGKKETVKVNGLCNRGEWFGETWIMFVGYFGNCYVVEATNEQDAIDSFVDSKYGYMIKTDDMCEACQADDYDNCTCDFAGNYSERVNLDDVQLFKCKVNYFAKKAEE